MLPFRENSDRVRENSDRADHKASLTVVSAPGPRDGDDSAPAVRRAVQYLLDRHVLVSGHATPHTIAVVSALGREGVTTVSRSLAEILATESEGGVCWIDFGEDESSGSRRRPKARRPDASKVPAAIETVTIPSTRLAAAEKPLVEPLTHLHVAFDPLRAASLGPAFADLLEDLDKGYEHVVLDTPPLLSRTGALGLLRHVDAYILVTRHGLTTTSQVQTINDELRTIPCLGSVLNDFTTRTPKFIRRFLPE